MLMLAVRGEEDFFLQDEPFAETVKRLPKCRAVTRAETGHYPMMERPEESVEIITDSLSSGET